MTPRLRRYARALVTGTAAACDVSDALVHAALMRALGARSLGAAADLPIRLYATVTQLHRDLASSERGEVAANAGARGSAAGGTLAALPPPPNTLAAALLRLPLDERETLLLVALERLDHATAARILRVSRPVLLERLTRARTLFGQQFHPAAAPAPPPAATRVPYLRLVVG